MKWFLGLWILVLAVKIGLSALLPFAPDEAYYWVWSQFPQLSYFDHPGMVSWLFWLGSWFSFLPHGERLPAILLNHSLLLVWFFILREIWSENLTKQWLLLVLASPFLGLGSILVTPDSPVLFFWSLSLFFFLKRETSGKPYWSFLLGLALGLGFCSKYHIVLLVFGLVCYLFAEKKMHLLRWQDWALTAAGGLLTCWPVLLWNYQNEFQSFLFQLGHGLGKDHWQPHWTGDYIVGQLLAFFPTFFVLYFTGVRFRRLRIFFWTALIPWALFFFSSFRGAVQANWPIVAYHAALVLVVAAAPSRRHIKTVVALWVVAEVFVLSQWVYPWWESAPDKLQEVHRLRAELSEIQHDPWSQGALFGGSYQIASVLWYYGGEPVYKLRGMSRYDFFDQLEGSTPKTSHFYLLRNLNEPLPQWLAQQNPKTRVIRSTPHYELLEVSP